MRPTPRRLWLGAAIVVVLVAGLALLGYQRGSSAYARLLGAQAMVQPAGGRPDVRTAVAACAELEAALSDAAPLLPFARVAGLLPFERPRAWGQLPLLAEAGQQGCQAVSAAGRLLAAADTGPEGNAGMALLAALRADRRDVEAAAAGLRAALDALDRVDLTALGAEERFKPLAPRLAAARGQAAELRAAAALAPRLPELANRLLGGDRARTYLLVGQNNDEARATGGFIGTLGLFTLAQGRVVATDVRSSYLWDRPEAPKPPAPLPLQQYMNFGGWYLRDANWWLDFRHTAAQLLLMWEREQGKAADIDGVIAVDQHALGLLLDAAGGADVPELGGHVTSGSVGALLDEARRSGALRSYADYHLRKTEALSALQRALMQKLAAARGPELLQALSALGRAAQEKYLLVWFRDPELQALAGERGWDGRVDPGPGDFLGVVDTMVSYGKLMPYIERRVGYGRRPDGAAVLDVTYTNRFRPEPGAPWDPLIDGTWWDWRAGEFRKEQGAWLGYVRVLAPAGSRLLDAGDWDDAPTLTAEGRVAVFGAPLLVRPGETRTARLTYANPTPVDAPLRVYRQPGTSGPAHIEPRTGDPR